MGLTDFSLKHMVVIAEYELDQILPLVGFGQPRFCVVIDGVEHWVKMNSVRLECFKRNQKCVTCDISGNLWRLERTAKDDELNKAPHFNLYHRRFIQLDTLTHPRTVVELMTRDHIIPRSKGGGEGIDNMQTMCYPCNQDKADKLAHEEAQKSLGTI